MGELVLTQLVAASAELASVPPAVAGEVLSVEDVGSGRAFAGRIF